MANGIQEPSLRSVGKLLSGDTAFSVPIHQRNFDWGRDETEELWDDICFAMSRDEDYFLGTVVLREIGPDSYEIIDGQQRLTCISMIFSAIRNEFKSRNDERSGKVLGEFLESEGFERDASAKPKFTLNETNNEIYRRYVFESENQETIAEILKDRKRLRPSNQKLLEAYRYFLSQVNAEASAKGTKYDEFLVPLINCLSRRLKLIVIPVVDEEGAYLVFESVNARGKELAVSDLLKNRLYYEVGTDQVSRAKNLWDQMEVSLGGRAIPEYLRHFWIAKRADSGNRKVREKALYREILRTFPESNRQNEAMELLSDLSVSAHDYAMISDYSLWPDSPNYGPAFKEVLEELERFRVSQCYPVLLNVIQVFEDDEEVSRVFEAIANFSFRYNIIGSGTSGTLESIFGKIAYEIRIGNYTSSQDIADQLRSVNPDAAFRIDFELATMSRRKSKLARYTLAEIENYLRRQKMGESLSTIDPDDRRVSLEHILPQSEENLKNWRHDFGPNLDPLDYVYRIGNLTLLTRKLNRQSADDSFAAKKAVALDQSDLLIDDYVRQASVWGDKEIEQRQQQLAKYAVEVWKL